MSNIITSSWVPACTPVLGHNCQGLGQATMGNGLRSALTTRGSAKEAPILLPPPTPSVQAVEVPRTEPDPVISDQGDTPANRLVEVLLSLILQQERQQVSTGVCWDSSCLLSPLI